MDFRILGPLEVRGESGPVSVDGIKPRAILAVLLLHPNQPVSAERLALALWGDDAPTAAVKTVQVHISRLRKALGTPQVLATTPAGYQLRVGPDELDAERFARGLEEGRRALAGGDAEEAADRLRESLALWRGPPLAELEFTPFAQSEIARLEEQRLAAVEDRIEADLAAGRHGALVGELRRLVSQHSTRERLAAQLMLALYRSGRQADALAAYVQTRKVLVEQVGAEPGPALQALQQAILVHDPALSAPPAAAGKRSVLPMPPNRTIGRAEEIDALAERIRGGSARLITVTGPGGVGKTRLALEVARAVEGDFADGAHMVRLAAVRRAADVPAAIMGALAIVPLDGESPADAVERFVAAKHLLLVVDNCEHLPEAAPFFAQLAASCRDLSILATSREPLNVQAEELRPLSPLALPASETASEALARIAAVALFCERGRAHDPAFRLDDGNAGAVAQICRRVDGLPLAIELAAARCGLLSASEIDERLDAALGTLGPAPRDAPARHRTLRATLGWSHDLLSAEEKACFSRFAVFSGGATVAAAEAVTGAAVDTLDRLVAKSLLVRRQVDGRARLGMLETVRAYALERFAALPDGETVREHHHRFYVALARRHGTDPALTGTDRKSHFAALDAENGNFAAALEWAVEQEGDELLELAAALVIYWFFRQRYTHALEWIERALRRPDGDPELRAYCLCLISWTLWTLGRTDEQAAVMREADAITAALPLTATRVCTLRTRAVQEACDGRFDVAAAVAEQAEICACARGDRWEIAVAAYARAWAADGLEELRAGVDRAASLLVTAENVFHLADLFQMAGHRALSWSGDADAAEYLARAVALSRELDEPYLWMLVRGKFGLAALLSGDAAAADEAFREELELARALVVRPVAFEGLGGLAAVAVVRGDLDRAARLYGAAGAHRYGEPHDAVDLRLRGTFFAPARVRRGEDAWDAAARAGATLSFAEAIACALDETPVGDPVADLS